MFEILSLIIIQCRCTLNRRLEFIFKLFCYNDEVYMQKGEYKFMMNKLCNCIAATIQIKSSFMQELMRNIDSKLLVYNKEYLYEKDFVNSMNSALKELSEKLNEITAKCDIFALQFQTSRLPHYLEPGNHFLGQYLITKVMPYYLIINQKLLSLPSVFDYQDQESESSKKLAGGFGFYFEAAKLKQKQKIYNQKYLFKLNYSFRAKAEAVFQNHQTYIFDFFCVNDQKFEQFYLFHNLWRETLLLNFLKADPRVSKVLNFGCLPLKVIYREIQELQGITLEDFIATRQKNYIIEIDSKHTSSDNLFNHNSERSTRKTMFTEYETIEIAIQIINLLDVLHSKNIVHTNLNPSQIFLVDGDI